MIAQIIFPVLVMPQIIITEPPITSDGFEWMRWVIVVLAGFLLTAFGVINKIHADRLEDKNKTIAQLLKTNEDLNNDKDALHKDIIEKVIPAVVSATDLIRSFMNK